MSGEIRKVSDNRDRFKKFDAYEHAPRSARKILDINLMIEEDRNTVAKTGIVPIETVETPVEVTKEEPHVEKESSEIAEMLESISINEVSNHDTAAADQDSTQGWAGQLFVRLSYAFGFAIFVATMTLSAKVFVLDRQAGQQSNVLSAESINYDAQGVELGTGDEPRDEVPAGSAFFAHKTTGDQPRFIRIPILGTYARVKQLVEYGGVVENPGNIHDAGWYSGSAMPGDRLGVSLYLGHTIGSTKDGVFVEVHNLTVGDHIEIEDGSGDVHTYEVDKKEEASTAALDHETLLSNPTNKHILKLVTSVNIYNNETGLHSSRIIITANPAY
ncbi:MAG: hypothetical protein ACI9T8_000135 [Candidatus Saccharimonadales bacterium]|jgi:hypothetical protein